MLTKQQFDLLCLAAQKKEMSAAKVQDEQNGLSENEIFCVKQELRRQRFLAGDQITPEGLAALEPYRVKRIIFIAAGFGRRMVPVTLVKPKGMVKVNGVRMIDTLIDAAIAAEIPDIVIVRGYKGEAFDELLEKYPQIRFFDNPHYDEGDNIISAEYVVDLLENCYILDSDFILREPSLIRKYEYESIHCGIPAEQSDDWILETDENGIIQSEGYGGKNTHIGISVTYWDAKDGNQLGRDIDEVFHSKDGKKNYWQAVPFTLKKENYQIKLRECSESDIVEIDSFEELVAMDSSYADFHCNEMPEQ